MKVFVLGLLDVAFFIAAIAFFVYMPDHPTNIWVKIFATFFGMFFVFTLKEMRRR